MKLAAIVLAAFTLAACAGDTGPPAPSAPNAIVPTPVSSPPGAVLWGMIVQENGVCIEGATVRVVRGQRAGESMPQTTPCDAWSYGGFTFSGLTPGVEMTLRASATGYADEEQTVTPSLGPQTAMLFAPRALVSVTRD